MANNPLSSRNTDLMKKDLVNMLRGSRVGSSRYAIVDADRRMSHTKPPSVKGPKVDPSWTRKPKRDAPAGGKLRKLFG